MAPSRTDAGRARAAAERFLIAWLLLCAAGVAAWWSFNADRIAPLAPRVFLSRNAGDWSLLYDATTPEGIDSLGGEVLVEHVTAVECVGRRYVIGTTQSGESFLFPIQIPGPREPAHALLERFPPDRADDWRTRCHAVGVTATTLRAPDSVARRPNPH